MIRGFLTAHYDLPVSWLSYSQRYCKFVNPPSSAGMGNTSKDMSQSVIRGFLLLTTTYP